MLEFLKKSKKIFIITLIIASMVVVGVLFIIAIITNQPQKDTHGESTSVFEENTLAFYNQDAISDIISKENLSILINCLKPYLLSDEELATASHINLSPEKIASYYGATFNQNSPSKIHQSENLETYHTTINISDGRIYYLYLLRNASTNNFYSITKNYNQDDVLYYCASNEDTYDISSWTNDILKLNPDNITSLP